MGLTPPPGRGAGVAPADGRGAVGIGGFPGTFGPPGPGFAATGGGGLGFEATGGGGLGAKELDGRELAGLESVDAPLLACGVFFHGAAEPFDGPIPGKTAMGFADASAVTDLMVIEGPVPGPAGGGGGRRPMGGGGGAATAFGFGGTSSR